MTSKVLNTVPPSGEVACNRALQDVIAERVRQINVEGWHAGHDDEHDACQLARAAACYAMHGTATGTTEFLWRLWPWDRKWWKPRDYRRNLVRAAALMIAEIERLDRSDGRW